MVKGEAAVASAAAQKKTLREAVSYSGGQHSFHREQTTECCALMSLNESLLFSVSGLLDGYAHSMSIANFLASSLQSCSSWSAASVLPSAHKRPSPSPQNAPRGCSAVAALVATSIKPPILPRNRAGTGKPSSMIAEKL